ncbi:hemagglutinin repeat-containing protein [Pseudomonas sp. S2_C03]
MDVRQFTFLASQPSASVHPRDSFWGLPKRGLALMLANAIFWQPIWALADGIVVNGSATTVGQAANGVPVVNIAAPNGAGLSHNQYSDFNVGQQGVILNNATNNLQSTQLGGYIIGNSNLNGRAANLILNEVNGGSPSQLKGYTEVAGQAAHEGENGVSKGSSVLKGVDAVGQFLSGPTGDLKIGNSKQSSSQVVIEQTNRSSTLNAGNDVNLNANNDVVVNGSRVNAGRDINVKGRDVTFDVAKGGVSEESQNTESWGGIHGGTSGGIKLGVGGSYGTSSADSTQDSSTVTQLGAGRDVNLKASNDLNLIGTQVKAERDIDLSAGNELNIRSAHNDSSSDNNRHNGGGEAGLTFGSQGVGLYVSVNIGKGNLEREGEQQQEAYLYAGNRLGFSSGKDTNIAGANLRGDEVVGRVGGDLNVSSVADTGKVKGKEFDISATGSFVGVSGSVGYGQTTGKTNWVEEQTSITGKSKVDIRTENHTQIDGAVIAADNGNLKLDTGTLGFSDIAGKDKEHGYYLNVGGTYGGSGAVQDGSQVGKGKEGKSGWSLEGWNYEKDREQIVRATVGAGEIVVRNDEGTGKDSTVGLNRDLDKAYEITRDKESRTDLYVTSSSVKAVLNPADTLQGWKDSVSKYGENAEETLHKLGDLLIVGATLGTGTGAELVNRQQIARELTRQLGNRNEETRAKTVKILLARVAPSDQSKDFELVAQRLTDMAGQDPDKAMQVLAVMYRMNLLQQTQHNFVPVLVAGSVLLGALATSLAATQLPPERQAEMQTAVSSAIDSIERGVSDATQRAVMVKMIVDVALENMGLPIHVLDPRLKKYEGLLAEMTKQNPSSGGYAEGGQAVTTPNTGGTQLDGQQGGSVYVTPGHQLNPGVVYNNENNAEGAKGVPELVEAHSLVGSNRAVIDPRKLTDYALNPDHPVGGNKARVFESVLGFTKGNSDLLMKQLQEGVMKNTPTPGKVDQYGARFTVDIPVTGPNGSGVVRSGWIYKPGSNTPELTTIFVK